MDSKIFNAPRIIRLQELRKKLPARCAFGVIISEKLEKQGIEITKEQIYQMVRGQRTVHEKVLEEMQILVNELEKYTAELA